MRSSKDKLLSIPTNVITGFLGVGKSTAVLQLLKQKPKHERWAILVNEFGEVGIDGGLLGGQNAEEQGVFISEVPGGCMCCAAGLPMQIALTRLLSRARPHRLLIEPTGLGHPREVLEVLSAAHYQEVLKLQATITLVDARKISDVRYTRHETFQQQLAIADVIVANKADQYAAADFPALIKWLEQDLGFDQRPLFEVEQAKLSLDWLQAPALRFQSPPQHQHAHETAPTAAPPLITDIPECGYLSIDNEGEGFFSRGWIFKPEWTFDSQQLYALLLSIHAERIKAVFITERGITAYNKADKVLSESPLADCLDSRIEIISSDKAAIDGLEPALLASIINRYDSHTSDKFASQATDRSAKAR